MVVNNSTKIDPQKSFSFDVMNVLACLAVITLHHNGLVHSYIPTKGWIQSLVVECGFYWAVPVFLMISGANLMNYRDRYDTKTFFKKRIDRTVIPWLAWSVIMIIWKVKTGQITLGKSPLVEGIDLIFHYKVIDVYWFFGELFACYLAVPVFSMLRKERRVLWYVVGLNFILKSCLPVFGRWLHFSWSMDVPVVGSLMIFVLLGYLLATESLSSKQIRMAYFLGGICVLFRFIYTWYFSALHGATDTSIKGYGSFHGVLYSAAVFLFLYWAPWEKLFRHKARRFISHLSSYSFGIYLLHQLVMYYEANLFQLNNNIIWRTLCIIPTYVICVIIIATFKRIPIIKHIV